MKDLVVGFVTGMVAVLVPAVFVGARVLAHATRQLRAANAAHRETQRLFERAQLLRSDEDHVAELAFHAWTLERKLDVAVYELRARDRAARRALRVPRLLWALAGVGAAAIALVALRCVG